MAQNQNPQKIVSFPISLGTVKLMFTKVGREWQCHLTDEFMLDLESALDGKVPEERVRWVDIPDIGAGNGSDFPSC